MIRPSCIRMAAFAVVCFMYCPLAQANAHCSNEKFAGIMCQIDSKSNPFAQAGWTRRLADEIRSGDISDLDSDKIGQIAGLLEKDELVRYWAALILGSLGDKARVAEGDLENALNKLNEQSSLQEGTISSKYAIDSALDRISGRSSTNSTDVLVEQIIKQINETPMNSVKQSDWGVFLVATIKELSNADIGSAPVDGIAALLHNDNYSIRVSAAHALSVIGLPAKRTIPMLEKALAEAELAERIPISQTMYGVRTTNISDPIRAALNGLRAQSK